MISNILAILKVITIFYVGIAALLFVMQRKMIYYPTAKNNHPYDEHTFDFDGAKIKVVALNADNAEAILYFGGNAEPVEYNTPLFENIFTEHAVFLMKYRGYGGSTGKPSEEKIYADALRIFDDLDNKYSKVSVIGRSLGSGVATYVAAQRNVHKLVLITPFDSIQALAQKAFPIYPMSLLLKDKHNSIGRADSINAITLLLIAENDEVIGKNHSDALFRAFKRKPPKMIVINNVGHNTISESDQFNEQLRQFMDSG